MSQWSVAVLAIAATRFPDHLVTSWGRPHSALRRIAETEIWERVRRRMDEEAAQKAKVEDLYRFSMRPSHCGTGSGVCGGGGGMVST